MRGLVETDLLVGATVIMYDSSNIAFIAIVVTMVLVARTLVIVCLLGWRLAGRLTSPFFGPLFGVFILKLFGEAMP